MSYAIENYTNNLIVEDAKQQAYEVFDELEKSMEGLNIHWINYLPDGNNKGMFAHFFENYKEDFNCQIYHYRNLEGKKIHYDVFEIVIDGNKFEFEKAVDAHLVSDKENCF